MIAGTRVIEKHCRRHLQPANRHVDLSVAVKISKRRAAMPSRFSHSLRFKVSRSALPEHGAALFGLAV